MSVGPFCYTVIYIPWFPMVHHTIDFMYLLLIPEATSALMSVLLYSKQCALVSMVTSAMLTNPSKATDGYVI
jgi:hypothetical protein